MSTTLDARAMVYAQRAILGTVSGDRETFVCPACLGPKPAEFDQCYPCHVIHLAAPEPLRRSVIAATAASEAGAWYHHLATYKSTEPDKGTLLGAVLAAYFREHQSRIAELLGGEPTIVTCVPSKKGRTFQTQPLRAVIARVVLLRDRLTQLAVYRNSGGWRRQRYQPEYFEVDRAAVRRARVLVVEDTFVSGATPISTAGAILEAGADAVAILAIARCVNPNFTPADHPYRIAMEKPYDLEFWPRS